VSSANLGLRFDLANVVVKSHRKAEFGPKKNCLIMKLSAAHQPRATAMLFANGKLVCTGANSEDAIKAAARKFTQLIQKMDYAGVNLIDFKIQNVVASCHLGFRVLLEELSFAHSDACTVRPQKICFTRLPNSLFTSMLGNAVRARGVPGAHLPPGAAQGQDARVCERQGRLHWRQGHARSPRGP
jgi:hypothetical protein